MIARRKTVVEPEVAIQAAPAKGEEPKEPARVVVFWKVHPGIVKFDDGTELVFKGNRMVVADDTLIQKIAAVADKFRILVANGEPI